MLIFSENFVHVLNGWSLEGNFLSLPVSSKHHADNLKSGKKCQCRVSSYPQLTMNEIQN